MKRIIYFMRFCAVILLLMLLACGGGGGQQMRHHTITGTKYLSGSVKYQLCWNCSGKQCGGNICDKKYRQCEPQHRDNINYTTRIGIQHLQQYLFQYFFQYAGSISNMFSGDTFFSDDFRSIHRHIINPFQ